MTLVAAIAAWAGTALWLHRRIEPAARRPAPPGSQTRFVALAWDRLVPRPDGRHLDRETFRAQVEALSAAGYQPVTLAEVEAFYRARAPMPAKPLLLSFDEGYLSTYESADPVLREHRWPGVMFLRTDRQEHRDVSFLFWDRIVRMVESGLWEVATGDPSETIADDGATLPPGAATIEARLSGTRVRAWAPRGASAAAGRSPGNGRWIEFHDDPLGANDASTPTRRLRRLRVSWSWTAEELVRRVDLALAEPAPAISDRPPAALWVAGEGTTHVEDGRVVVEGSPRGEAWLPGTQWTEGWVLEVRFVRDSGEIWFVQPAVEPGREWRFGGDGTGLYLEERIAGRPPSVLGRSPRGLAPGVSHHLRLVRRGPGVAVIWDGERILDAPLALPGRWRGKLGIVSYAAGSRARSTISELALGALPFRARPVAADLSAGDVRALSADAENIAAISPPWAVLEGGSLRERPFDARLVALLARRFAWDIVPRVHVRGAPSGSEAWVADLASRVERAGWAGVDVSVDGTSRANEAWDPSLAALDAALRRSGRRLLVSGVPREGTR